MLDIELMFQRGYPGLNKLDLNIHHQCLSILQQFLPKPQMEDNLWLNVVDICKYVSKNEDFFNIILDCFNVKGCMCKVHSLLTRKSLIHCK